MRTVTVECPDRLAAELDEFVKDGWAVNEHDAIIEALRRFLNAHRPDVARAQIHADLDWGLHGRD